MARADAVRNRARLIEAAAAAFRDEGLGASVNAIASDAGVNVATLYRHFPAKEDLLDAVLDSLLDPLVHAVDRALAAPAGEQLACFLHDSVRLKEEHRGLAESLTTEVRARLRDPALAIVRPLVDASHASGELRRDFDAEGVLIAMRMVASTSVVPDSARYAEVVLRGLRP
jgi:AcrR family transcriptional regulator